MLNTSSKIKDLLSQKTFDKILLQYENCYGTVVVGCIIYPVYFKSCPVFARGLDEDHATLKAIKLYYRVRELEKKIGTNVIFEGSYCREYGETFVHFKNIGRTEQAVQSVYTQENGFILVDEPFPISDFYPKPESVTSDRYNEFKEKYGWLGPKVINPEMLPEEEMYFWDDIWCLTGSAGLIVVRNGMVIKSKTIAIA